MAVNTPSRYHFLFDQASDPIIITDQLGNFIDFNASAIQLFGYTREELMQANIFLLIDPVQTQDEPMDFKLLAEGKSVLHERKMVDKQGKIIYVESHVKLLPDGSIIAVIRDISERKLAEERLQKSEQDFRTLFSQASDGIFLSGPDGSIYDANLYACRLTNYSREELIRMNFRDIFFAEDLEKTPLRFPEILNGQEVLTERRIRRKDGTPIDIESSTKLLSDNRILSIMRNISVRKRKEHDLQESEHRFRMIVEHFPIAIACYNGARELVFLNQQFTALTGYKIDDIPTVEHFNEKAYPPDPAYMKWVYEAWTATQTARLEVEWRRKDGEVRNVEMTKSVWEGLTYVIANDITERKKLERQLEQQQRLKNQQITEAVLDAQESERSQIGEELHDNINQMLVASKMFLDTALHSVIPDRELLQVSLEHIHLAIEEIRKLSRNLIAPSLKVISLKESIQTLADNFLLTDRMDITLDVSRFDETILNKEQKVAVYRIIQEQLTNIIKYAAANSIGIRLYNEGEKLTLIVSDNGVGFDPSTGKKGIGMTNILSRAELYNGRARFDSAPGKGCRLEVILNVAKMDQVV